MAQGIKRGSACRGCYSEAGVKGRRRIRNETARGAARETRRAERRRKGGEGATRKGGGKDSNGESVHLPGVLSRRRIEEKGKGVTRGGRAGRQKLT